MLAADVDASLVKVRKGPIAGAAPLKSNEYYLLWVWGDYNSSPANSGSGIFESDFPTIRSHGSGSSSFGTFGATGRFYSPLHSV